MDKIKILGICGSPKRKGNTSKLINKVLEGAQKSGASTEFVSLSDKELNFCKACMSCLEEGKCIIDDDLEEIRNKLLEAQGLILGSPTYNREVTAQLKTLFDRIWYDIHNQSYLGKYSVWVNTYVVTKGYS